MIPSLIWALPKSLFSSSSSCPFSGMLVIDGQTKSDRLQAMPSITCRTRQEWRWRSTDRKRDFIHFLIFLHWSTIISKGKESEGGSVRRRSKMNIGTPLKRFPFLGPAGTREASSATLFPFFISCGRWWKASLGYTAGQGNLWSRAFQSFLHYQIKKENKIIFN